MYLKLQQCAAENLFGAYPFPRLIKEHAAGSNYLWILIYALSVQGISPSKAFFRNSCGRNLHLIPSHTVAANIYLQSPRCNLL